MSENLKLWESVEKTNPAYTKKATLSGGNKVTAISPQYQIKNATEKFGAYGCKWGFKNIKFDYTLTNQPIKFDIVDYKTKQTEAINSTLGLVIFSGEFFYPEGSFEITNSIKIFTDKKHNIIDDNFAKKLETDTLTKALSKLGFNADIFLGKFDDVRYVNEMKEEFKPKPIKKVLTEQQYNTVKESKNKEHAKWFLDNTTMTEQQNKDFNLILNS